MMQTEIDTWQGAPLWDPNSIEQTTKTWFQYMRNEENIAK